MLVDFGRSWPQRLQIISGLILFTFALFHFINLTFGLISLDLMLWFQEVRQVITRSVPGSIILGAALLTHMGLVLYRLARRSSLKMPLWEWIRIVFGFSIPFLLIPHVVKTRGVNILNNTDDDYLYVLPNIWPDLGWQQSILLLIVWIHACIGLHYWLRLTSWWPRAQQVMISIAVLIPAFALAGFMTAGRYMHDAFGNPVNRALLMAEFKWPDAKTLGELLEMTGRSIGVFWGLLALVAMAYALRKLRPGPNTVRIQYVDGPEVTSPKGPTLLEISEANGVAHTALCGGRGRCTTCRVIVQDGADLLHPPSEAEARSLKAVNAPPGSRLACQIRPTNPLTVFRVFRPDGRRGRAHASQGQERQLAVLFLDMRGFTARTAGQLPYDVVFLLNRFFDVIVPSITGAGGKVDKYLGDGLLALFETPDERSSARAALRAAAGIGSALATFNRTLAAEGGKPVAIGIGLHLGDVVLGEIGAAGDAPRTLIGDTVNTASRMEGKTKELGVQVLVSAALLEAAGVDTAALELIRLELRGVAEPVEALALENGTELGAMLQQAESPSRPVVEVEVEEASAAS